MIGKRIKILLSLLAMALLILNSRQAVSGAADGIKLCLYTILPALLPYCVLSLIFQSLISGEKLWILKPIERLFRIPESSGIVFLLGILGGYPTGAICANRLRASRSVTTKLAVFCNNAGPSFIFGVVYMLFPSIKSLFSIWLIQITSALLTGMIIKSQNDPITISPLPKRNTILKDTANAMLNVCMTVILFRVLISCIYPYTDKLMPKVIQIFLYGIMELSNGIILLQSINNSALQFIVCCGILSFGGMCVALQTASIVKNIDIKQYVLGKALHALLSMCLAVIVIFKIYILLCLPLAIVIIQIINHDKKKGVAFLK